MKCIRISLVSSFLVFNLSTYAQDRNQELAEKAVREQTTSYKSETSFPRHEDLFLKPTVGLTFVFGNESQSIKNSNVGNQNYSDISYNGYNLEINFDTDKKFKTGIIYGLSFVDYNKAESIKNNASQQSKNLVKLGVQSQYMLNSNWTAQAKIILDQNIIVQKTSSSLDSTRVVVPKVILGAVHTNILSSRFHLYVAGNILTNLSRKKGNLILSAGNGVDFTLGLKSFITPKYLLDTYLNVDYVSFKYENTGAKYDVVRNSNRLGINFSYLF